MISISYLAVRVILAIIMVAIYGYVAFRQTPQLNGIEQAFLFRFSLMMMLLRVTSFLLFDTLMLFPLPE